MNVQKKELQLNLNGDSVEIITPVPLVQDSPPQASLWRIRKDKVELTHAEKLRMIHIRRALRTDLPRGERIEMESEYNRLREKSRLRELGGNE